MDNSVYPPGFNPNMSERVQFLLSDCIFGMTLVPEGKVWNYEIGLTQLWSSNLPFSMVLDTPLLFWVEEHWPAAFLTVSSLISWRPSISDNGCLSQCAKIKVGRRQRRHGEQLRMIYYNPLRYCIQEKHGELPRFLASLSISDNGCLSRLAKMGQGVSSPPALRNVTITGVTASH